MFLKGAGDGRDGGRGGIGDERKELGITCATEECKHFVLKHSYTHKGKDQELGGWGREGRERE